MFYGAMIAEQLKHDVAGYGFDVEVKGFNWATLKEKELSISEISMASMIDYLISGISLTLITGVNSKIIKL